MSAPRVTRLVLAVALLLTACSRATPPTPVQPETVDCEWRITLQSFPGMDAAITPPVTVPARGHQTMTITTNLGVITVDIDLARTPCTAASMDFLASTHVLDTVTCPVLDTTMHTLICAPQKVVGYEYPDENLPAARSGPWYHAGDVALVNDGPGTNAGRFFLAYGDNRLGGSYPLWGHVTGGLSVLQRIGEDGEDEAFAGGGAGPFAGPGAGHPHARLTIQSVTVGPVH